MSVTSHKPRTSWQVTRSVWYALFMRETISRTTADRFGWFWMIAEPMAMVGLMVAIRSLLMGGDRFIPGADFVPWLIVGLLGFFVFREGMMRSLGAIEANRGLFSYRQVLPVDPVIARCLVEGMIKTFILIIFIVGGVLFGVDLFPDDPLTAIVDWLSLWSLGFGAGLVFSVVSCLVPEVAILVRISLLPLMIVSGVILPLNFLPHPVLEIVLYLPIVHGLENLRSAFFSGYHPLQGASEFYLWFWALALIVLGLAMHIHNEAKLKAL
ncbi:MAG: ABC transporter permease [Paraglaciecola chathamensis]|uniref:ABC transporter permease n=1 Tax=Neptunomonas phycophila TaxID=1572645 RepID=UPI0009489E05|nr:ABC transporter permease [Neptunomonas phycophila]